MFKSEQKLSSISLSSSLCASGFRCCGARLNFSRCLRMMMVVILLPLFAMTGCKDRSAPSSALMVPEVSVVTLVPEPILITSELPGRTVAFLVAEIRPQVHGLIQRRLFTEGSEVQAGDILYQIDPAPFLAALDSAKAALARAEAGASALEARVSRYTDLLSDNAISRQDYDDAAAALKQAEAEILHCQANIQTAEINLAYTAVKAPISGRIGRSTVTDGALVTAYQPLALATIQQLDPIYVDTPQSTSALLKMRRRFEDGRLNYNSEAQDKVQLLLEDGTSYALEGTLQFQDISVDSTTGSVTLRAVFPNPDGLLLPGMFVRMTVTAGVNQEAILVPQQSVMRDAKGDPMVLIVNNEGQVQPRMLQLDRAINSKWLVTSGLQAGDRVIVEGLLHARPGATVKPIDFEPHTSASDLHEETQAH